jgi:branched-chain amino acid transport system substrate-binding protein
MRQVIADFRNAYEKANGAAPTDAFSAYTFDAWLCSSTERGARSHRRGTRHAGLRVALRDAIVTTRELVGTHSVYNFKTGHRYGSDERLARGRTEAREGHMAARACSCSR